MMPVSREAEKSQPEFGSGFFPLRQAAGVWNEGIRFSAYNTVLKGINFFFKRISLIFISDVFIQPKPTQQLFFTV